MAEAHINTSPSRAYTDISSPPRTRAERAASCRGADANERQPGELNSDLNASTSSPSRSSPSRTCATGATNVATDVNEPEYPSDSEIRSTFEDDEYEDDSNDEVDDDVLDPDYNGDLYEDDYSDDEESMHKYRVPSARGKGYRTTKSRWQ